MDEKQNYFIFSTKMLNNLQLLKHRTNHNKKHMLVAIYVLILIL